jgi:hypothetical protein
LLAEVVPLLIQKDAALEDGLSYNVEISFAFGIDQQKVVDGFS